MIIHSDEIYVYGYFQDHKLNGIIRVDDYDDRYELSFFFVNTAFQKGVGQYLFQSILRRFKDKKLILYVYKDNIRAIRIYEKYGFKVVDTAYGLGYTPDKPHYVMQKDI